MAPQATPAAPVAPAGAAGGYASAGSITAEQVINGDPAQFAHLDERLAVLTAQVQKSLVDSGRSTQLDQARFDPEVRAALSAEIDRLALSFLLQGRSGAAAETQILVASVVNEIIGLGPLEPLWLDPAITEVIVNGPDQVFVERAGRLIQARGARFRSQEHLLEICQRILSPLNRKLDVKDPLADGRLPDGSRVNAVHFAIAPNGPLLTIRRFPEVNRSLADLVDLGAMTPEMAQNLAWLVSNKATTLVVGGTGTGKSLDLATPIPTPSGFVRMGDLKVGDWVFDDQGAPTQVTGAYDVQLDRPCFRVQFSDGSSIVADAEHLWTTDAIDASGLINASTELGELEGGGGAVALATRSATQVTATTEQLRATLRAAEVGQPNHSIRSAGVVNFGEADDLLVAPRLLGLWLCRGEGERAVLHLENPELVAEFDRAGFPTSETSPNVWAVSGGLATRLLAEQVLQDAHIPHKYLFSSEAQRRELLSGLLDADGSVDANGWITFTSNEESLARDFRSLTSSLGYAARFMEMKTSLPGRASSVAYVVRFVGRGDEFTDPERIAELRSRGAVQASASRDILSIEPVPTRPVRCIRVAAESHLFLAGDTFTATHNTTMLNALSAAIPNDERVITIEDSLELRLSADNHVAAMEARPKDASGSNEVTIRALVKNALRMRPDRIIVGEIRDQAALDMLQACNTGHEGSMSTVHANGPNEAVSRMAVMVAQGGEIPADKVDWLVGSALDILIMIRRYKDGSRRVSGVYEVPEVDSLPAGQPLTTIPLWEWHRTGETPDGKLIGEYRKVNEVSERLREKLSLDFEPLWTWEQVLALSATR